MIAIALLGAWAGPDDAPEEKPDEVFVLGVLSGESLGGLAGVLEPVERAKGGVVNPGEVDIDYDAKRDTLTATNRQPYPVTFGMDLTRDTNTRVDPPVPFDLVLQPGEQRVVRFTPERKGEMSYSYRWGWKTGDHRATHRPEGLYRLPWPDDSNFECTQSYNGKYSHDDEHAMDVVMPVGTPILAARGGVVIEVTDGWGEGGPDRAYLDEANSVRVLHADGTVASYLHLRAGGMKVATGDSVKAGQQLAESGHSGFSRVPHLHFVVKSPLDAWVYRSWPVRFDVGGEPTMLGPGLWYPRDPSKP